MLRDVDVGASPSHQAVDRALQVLEHLGRHPAGLTLLELSSATGVPKPSLHRILASMRARGFAAQLQSGGVYVLGPAALEAAFTFHAKLDLRQLLHPLVLQVNRAFGQTAHLAVLSGPMIVYVDKLEADIGVRITSVVGGRNPAHATGVGKALLAHELPDDTAVRRWVAANGPLGKRTERTATTASALSKELRETRRRGYAIDDEESELGVFCVAARVPLVFGDLTPPTAISVTGLKQRMVEMGIERIATDLLHLIRSFEFASAPTGSIDTTRTTSGESA
jgi:IclR family acetate operon transcriptional repressor